MKPHEGMESRSPSATCCSAMWTRETRAEPAEDGPGQCARRWTPSSACCTAVFCGTCCPSIFDFRLSPRREVAAPRTFLRKAIKGQGSGPRTVTLDGDATSHRATRHMRSYGELPTDPQRWSSRYSNNLIEQDHRGVKLRTGPMLGLEWFRAAAITIARIKLLPRIGEGQFILVGFVFGINVRLLSGMQSWQRNTVTLLHVHSHNFRLVMLFAPAATAAVRPIFYTDIQLTPDWPIDRYISARCWPKGKSSFSSLSTLTRNKLLPLPLWEGVGGRGPCGTGPLPQPPPTRGGGVSFARQPHSYIQGGSAAKPVVNSQDDGSGHGRQAQPSRCHRRCQSFVIDSRDHVRSGLNVVVAAAMRAVSDP